MVILLDKAVNPMCFYGIPQLPFPYLKFVGLYILKKTVVFNGDLGSMVTCVGVENTGVIVLKTSTWLENTPICI